MAVNRFYRRTPYDIGLYTPPVEMMAATMQRAQQMYDQNYALAEEIKHNYIPSLPQDRAKANEIQKSWNQEIDSVVKEYNGDYSQAGKKLQGLLSKIRGDMAPGGTANAIVSNYNNYNTWLGSHQERLKQGKLLAEDLNLANSYYMKNYTGIGNIDPVTGTYNRFAPEDLMDYQDPEAIIQDIWKGFKPEKKKVGKSWVENGWVKHGYQEVEGIDPNRLYPSFLTGLAGSPKMTSYLAQKSKFMELDPKQALDYIDVYAKQRANNLGYMNESSDEEWKRDPMAVARYKASLDKQNMEGIMGSFLRHEPIAPNVAAVKPKIEPNAWRTSFDLGGRWGAASQAAYGMAGIGAYQYMTDKQPMTGSMTSLDAFMKDPKSAAKLQGKNVVPSLAKALWEKKKSDFAAEYSAKYGKDKKWTDKFESDFWWDYEKEATNNTSFQSWSFDIPEAARKTKLPTIIRDALSGRQEFYVPGEMGTRSTSQLSSKVKDAIYDKETGKLKLDALGFQYVIGGPGYQSAGYQVTTPEGTIVIVDPDAQRSFWSQQLGKSLNPIYFEGMSQGDSGLAGIDPVTGRPIEGRPNVRYDRSNRPGVQLDMNLEWDLGNGNKVIKNPGQLLEEVAPLFWNSLGYGQTKSAATPFGYLMGSLVSSQSGIQEDDE